MYAKSASVQGLWLTYLSQKREIMEPAWQQLSTWIGQGKLTPQIGQVFPLERAVDRQRVLLALAVAHVGDGLAEEADFVLGGREASLSARVYGEFAGENRPQGWNAWLTLVIALGQPGRRAVRSR